MSTPYFETILLTERVYRVFLDVINRKLDQEEIYDLTSIQALVIYSIGKNRLTVGELSSRGYYQGTNVSYNLKKMIQFGYVQQTPAEHDKRTIFIHLTPKGLKIYELISQTLTKHEETFPNYESLKIHLREFESFLLQDGVS